MPLRTLLGYEPRSVSRQSQDYAVYTPVRQVMATNKKRYQAPMARVKKLPPIDEESSGIGSPRPVMRRPTEATVRRLPKKVFSFDELDDDAFMQRQRPVTKKPTLAVRPMSRDRRRSPVEDFMKDFEKPQKLQHPYPVVSPKDVNHTIVDGLVADYLHYARYGHVIPVYEGTSSNTCPCCTDRNRQNVRTLLGFPKNFGLMEQPTKYDQRSTVKTAKVEKELESDSSMFPNSMYASLNRQKVRRQEPTPEEKRMKYIAEQSRRGPWVNYQPLPYATNYLNPEFNRPAELNSLYDIESHNSHLYTKHKVLEADTNFDYAMSKLNNYSADGRYGW